MEKGIVNSSTMAGLCQFGQTGPGTYFATITLRSDFLYLRLNIEGSMKILITLIGLLTTVSTLALADSDKMQYVDVRDQHGNVRKFSRLIMGTDHLLQSNWTHQGQGEPTEAQVFAVLDEALRRGINVIDTSPIYVGGVEHLIGKWVQSRKEMIRSDDFYVDKNLNPDRKIYVISKGGFPFDLFYSKTLESGPHSKELIQELKKQDILRSQDGAPTQPLQNVPAGSYASRLYGEKELIQQRVSEEIGHTQNNLNNDITVYLMHRDDFDSINFNVINREQTPVLKIMETLSKMQSSGKFAMLGWSNWTTDRVNESLKLSQNNPDLARPVFNSPYFSLFEMAERSIHARGIQVTHEEMMNPSFQRGVLMMPYSPLGGFSILDKPSWENAKADAKTKYEAGDPYWKNVYTAIFTAENEERYKRALAYTQGFNQSHKTSYTVDQMLNAYALAHARTDFLTVGPITIEQVQRTVESLPLSKMLKTSDLNFLYISRGTLPRMCSGVFKGH